MYDLFEERQLLKSLYLFITRFENFEYDFQGVFGHAV